MLTTIAHTLEGVTPGVLCGDSPANKTTAAFLTMAGVAICLAMVRGVNSPVAVELTGAFNDFSPDNTRRDATRAAFFKKARRSLFDMADDVVGAAAGVRVTGSDSLSSPPSDRKVECRARSLSRITEAGVFNGLITGADEGTNAGEGMFTDATTGRVATLGACLDSALAKASKCICLLSDQPPPTSVDEEKELPAACVPLTTAFKDGGGTY